MKSKSSLIPLGHISAAHGIKGEVLIKTYTDAPENIVAYGPLRNEDGTKAVTLKIVRVTNKGVVARVDGVSDRNGAEALKGFKLCVARDQLPEPENDEWYYSDLVGLDAVDASGALIGKVVAMHDFGAGDLMELHLSGEKSTQLIAFDKTTVPDVDIKSGRLSVILPEEISGEATADEKSTVNTNTNGKGDV